MKNLGVLQMSGFLFCVFVFEFDFHELVFLCVNGCSLPKMVFLAVCVQSYEECNVNKNTISNEPIDLRSQKCCYAPHIITICDGKADFAQRFFIFSFSKSITVSASALAQRYNKHRGYNSLQVVFRE